MCEVRCAQKNGRTEEQKKEKQLLQFATYNSYFNPYSDGDSLDPLHTMAPLIICVQRLLHCSSCVSHSYPINLTAYMVFDFVRCTRGTYDILT